MHPLYHSPSKFPIISQNAALPGPHRPLPDLRGLGLLVLVLHDEVGAAGASARSDGPLLSSPRSSPLPCSERSTDAPPPPSPSSSKALSSATTTACPTTCPTTVSPSPLGAGTTTTPFASKRKPRKIESSLRHTVFGRGGGPTGHANRKGKPFAHFLLPRAQCARTFSPAPGRYTCPETRESRSDVVFPQAASKRGSKPCICVPSSTT